MRLALIHPSFETRIEEASPIFGKRPSLIDD